MDVNGGNYPQLDGFYIYLLLYVYIWYMYIMENPINMYDLGVPHFRKFMLSDELLCSPRLGETVKHAIDGFDTFHDYFSLLNGA
jgi:hypothetical protein